MSDTADTKKGRRRSSARALQPWAHQWLIFSPARHRATFNLQPPLLNQGDSPQATQYLPLFSPFIK